jgi:excisionase family DNA binding protein
MESELTERRSLTVPEAGAELGISKSAAYEAIKRGEIPSIRIGRRIIVPRVALDRLFEQPGGKGEEK